MATTPEDRELLLGDGFTDFEIDNGLPKGSDPSRDQLPQNNRLSTRDIGGMLLGAANTATFEAAPTIGAGLLALPAYFTDEDFSTAFHKRYDPAMRNYKAFQEERPGLDIGARVVGGLAPLTPAAKVANYFLKGTAPTLAKAVGSAAKAGGADAAIRSLVTSGDDKNSMETLANAIVQGGIGMGVGGAVGGAVRGLGGLYNAARGYMQGVPDEISLITKRTAGVPEEELQRGLGRLETARANEQPMTMFDAVEAEQPVELAYQMAAKPANLAKTTDFIRDRSELASTRASRGLKAISPEEVDLAVAGKNLSDTATGKIEGDIAKRTASVEKGYKTIERGEHAIEGDNIVTERLSNPESLLNDYLGRVRRGSAKDRLANKADNSFEVLNEIKKAMDSDIKNASQLSLVDRQAATNAGDLTNAKNEILEEMKRQVPGYETVLRRYAKPSPEIERLQAGNVGRFADAEATTYRSLPGQLTKLTPAELTEMKRDLGPKGLAVLKENFRAHLEDLASRDDTATEVLKFLKKGSKGYDRLKTLLGEDDLDELYQFFDAERRMQYTNRAISGGSPTAPRQAGEKDLDAEAMPALTFAHNLKKKGPWGSMWDTAIDAILGSPEDKAKGLYGRTSERLYSTGTDAEDLIRAILGERLRRAPTQQAVGFGTSGLVPGVGSAVLDRMMNKRR